MALSNKNYDDDYVPEEESSSSEDDDTVFRFSVDELIRAVKKSDHSAGAGQSQLMTSTNSPVDPNLFLQLIKNHVRRRINDSGEEEGGQAVEKHLRGNRRSQEARATRTRQEGEERGRRGKGKAKAKASTGTSSGRGRGRPKKDEKKAESNEDEEEEEEEEEGDDN
ncbi:hypothetical protein GE061_004216 [Apolygus lucorum]|uniref:Uncharacterized protein n=1 Tax=Apolygus lucorum TaxID=248454 RepID=A0A8S9X0F3_APOLU|nr:hypothetical protein GE061_004216 [Apolygus lucorum]